MLEEVKRFHESLPQKTGDHEISSRLQRIVELALRKSYYDLFYASNKGKVLRDHMISAMIDGRAFERARDKGECIRVAEKITDEILKIGSKNLKKFFELYVEWNNAKGLLEAEAKKFSSHSSEERKKFQKKR